MAAMPLPRRVRMPLAVAAAVLAGALVGACTTSVNGSPHAAGRGATANVPPVHPIDFRDCTALIESQGVHIPDGLELGCGLLDVPLNYSDPTEGTISLAVLRVHATADTHPVGSLLVNPGGPGAPGVGAGLGVALKMSRSVLDKYDIVGFDPRGTGESAPVHCMSDAQKDQELATSTDVTTSVGFAAAVRDSTQLSQRCEHAVGADLPYYNTVNTARDMDEIRQAVGDPRMNYLGFSYGTELGWTYAHLFPRKVRAFVLDGAVDPEATPVSEITEQTAGFEHAFGQFAASCPAAVYCGGLGDATEVLTQILAVARTHPIGTGTPRPLTEALASTGVIEALYAKSMWPRLAQALVAAKHGEGAALLALADEYDQRSKSGHYSNLIDANVVISCNDTPVRAEPTDAQIRATIPQLVQRYPLFGADSADGLFACRGWPARRTPVPPPAAATPTTVLVLGNRNDPATPYQGAQHLTRELGHARLLTWDGQGHTSYLEGSTCVDDKVDQYLLTLHAPPAGTVCTE